MPDDSGGIYTVPAGTIVNTGDTLLPSQHNPWALDNATAVSARYSKDGRAPMTGNMNIGAFQIKNMADGTLATDAVTKQQLVGWEPIGAGSGGGGRGVYSGSGAASFNLTNLSAYRMISIEGYCFPSVVAALYGKTSKDNGATWDSGATDYTNQWDGSFGASFDAATASSGVMSLLGGATMAAGSGGVATFSLLLTQFNQAAFGFLSGEIGVNTGALRPYKTYVVRADSNARNGFQLLPSTGTFTYFISAKGLRG